MAHIIERLPQADRDSFMYLGYTIGGFIVFPGNMIDGKATINAARGLHRSIGDRFDLTLECIRRFYCQQTSPLYDTLLRYSRFFHLFGDFRGYVDFFFLQDMVQDDCSAVKFWLPFDNFAASPLPSNEEQYILYRKNVIDFINARNQRMEQYCNVHRL